MRKVAEWVASHDDQKIPDRVIDRVIARAEGKCAICTLKIGGKLRPAIDHIKALINGGAHRESNLQLLCVPDHKVKSRADLKEKATVYRKRKKHLGITKTKRPIGSRGFDKSPAQRTASRPIERRS